MYHFYVRRISTLRGGVRSTGRKVYIYIYVYVRRMSTYMKGGFSSAQWVSIYKCRIVANCVTIDRHFDASYNGHTQAEFKGLRQSKQCTHKKAKSKDFPNFPKRTIENRNFPD